MRHSPLPTTDRTNSNDMPRARQAPRRPRWKLPRWLVDDEFDRQMADYEEPPIERAPGWQRVLVIVGVNVGLWCVIIMGVSAMLGGSK